MAKKYIEAEVLKNNIHKCEWVHDIKSVEKFVDRLPAADVVEVVRCRECVYREKEQPGMVYCPNTVGGWLDENWFCAGGEKE